MAPEVLAAIIALGASVPGVLAIWYSVKTRRESKSQQTVDFGTDLAKTAFESMELQVKRLEGQQQQYDTDRLAWEHDKTELLAHVERLTIEMTYTNTYLHMLLAVLDANSIPRPNPPNLGLMRPPHV